MISKIINDLIDKKSQVNIKKSGSAYVVTPYVKRTHNSEICNDSSIYTVRKKVKYVAETDLRVITD